MRCPVLHALANLWLDIVFGRAETWDVPDTSPSPRPLRHP